jgi:Fe-S-cluster containining protein
MVHEGYLFTKIQFADFDVIVPFASACCGKCCERYIPHFLPEEVLRIARDKHWQPDVTLQRYLECYDVKLHGHAGPCPFLGSERLCTIHEHPLRPEVCRLYPFSFRDGDERCQSFCSHLRVVGALTAVAGAFDLYDSSFCPDADLRPVPDEVWPSILHRSLSADPPAGVISSFIAINHPLLLETGRRAASPSQVPA